MPDQLLTHFDAQGAAQMVDVSTKPATARRALAEGWLRMQAATLARIQQGQMAKGDVLGVARIAGIMAAKKTAELIPLCHPLPLNAVQVQFELHPDPPRVRCTAELATTAPTGVEMEALTAVQVALLTIYDMCKAVDRGMVMTEIRLLTKTGGQSGTWTAAD